MSQQTVALAEYSQEQVDALGHREIADRLRKYNHPLLRSAADSIDYLAAQEGLLERAQQATEQARSELAENKRPLDAQMARLNQRVIDLTSELDATRLQLPRPATPVPGAGAVEQWRAMEDAPRDGTLLRLLVEFQEHATEDGPEAAPTIGANNFSHDGEDRWQFAGWCWTHDHWTEGVGKPVGWMPFKDAP